MPLVDPPVELDVRCVFWSLWHYYPHTAHACTHPQLAAVAVLIYSILPIIAVPRIFLPYFFSFFFFFLLFSQTFHRAVSLLLFSLHFNAAPGWLLFWRRMFLFLMSSEQTHSSVYFIKSKTKRTISWLRGCSNWHFASLLCLDVLLFHWHRYQLDTALLCLVNIIWMYC